ncbi:MAG: ABC transporter permease [Roseburia sp.]
MFNLMSGEIYKWRKSKSFKVCCLITILFIFFMYGTLLMADKIQKGEVENGTASVVVETEGGSVFDTIGILDVEQVIFGTAAGIVTAVFVCIFVIGEYGNGAIKNIVGKGTSRITIFLAKYFVAMIAAMVLLLIAGIVTLLCGVVIFGADSVSTEILIDLCQYVGMQMWLGAVFAGIIVAIGELSRNLGVGIAISLCVYMLAGTLFSGLDLLFHKVEFRPSNYWISNLVSQCPLTDIGGDFLIRVLAASVFWIMVSLAAGMIHFKKADVK